MGRWSIYSPSDRPSFLDRTLVMGLIKKQEWVALPLHRLWLTIWIMGNELENPMSVPEQSFVLLTLPTTTAMVSHCYSGNLAAYPVGLKGSLMTCFLDTWIKMFCEGPRLAPAARLCTLLGSIYRKGKREHTKRGSRARNEGWFLPLHRHKGDWRRVRKPQSSKGCCK